MTPQERNTLGLIRKYESRGKNVMNYVGRGQGLDPTTAKGYTAQGYYQMLNSNWHRIAPLYNIKAKNAMAATDAEQTQVALHLLRHGGIGNWANYNPELRRALQRGERAPVTQVPELPKTPLPSTPPLGSRPATPWMVPNEEPQSSSPQQTNTTHINVMGGPDPHTTATRVAEAQNRLHERQARRFAGMVA
jgi:hypothetical protein